MKPKLCFFVPVQMKKINPKLNCFSICAFFVLLLSGSCTSLYAQQPLKGVALPYGSVKESNYQSFTGERISPDVWAKANPGKTFIAETQYKTFDNDSVKYVEVVSKRTAFESFYINPKDPAAYTKVKGLRPINFQRNGEWVPIDIKLRSMGKGIYEAPDQWDPTGINVIKHESYIKTPEGKVSFNNWSLYGVNAGNKVLLTKADWSHYTIGEDGIKITNIFPGIDAEMRIRAGGIKTSFIVRQLSYTQYEGLYFEDSFLGLSNEGFYFADEKHGSHETVYSRVSSLNAAIKISHAFAFAKKEPSIIEELPYVLSGNKLGFAITTRYLSDHLASGEVIIDPLVESFNSISQSLVGFMYNASCGFNNSCDYTISITPPANATVTGIANQLQIRATAPCQLNNFGFQTIVGTCVSPGPGGFWYLPGATYSGDFWGGYFNQGELLSCAPAPSCTPVAIDVTTRLFRGCVGPIDCDNTCLGLLSPLSVRIQGRTLELTPIIVTSNDSLCKGQDFTFTTSPEFGVPPYSAISWSLDVSGTPSLGTGNSITTGSALTVSGQYMMYARATDACGTEAIASTTFSVIDPIVLTAPPQTVCNGTNFNVPLIPQYPGEQLNWTVVQTGVTGASNGTGTSITHVLNNSGSVPGTVEYTVTQTAFGCTGPPVTHIVTVNPENRVLYVDALNGNDANCGDMWTSALKTVSEALRRANISTNVDTVLVAAGTYYPTSGTNRDSSFVIIDNQLKLYGGYPNGGGSRDIAGNPTILSGDIGVPGDSLDNSYHVMVIPSTLGSGTDSIVVDGFTITKGNATGTGIVLYDGTAAPQNNGGGIYIRDNTDRTTVLRNLTIKENTAAQLGGGMNVLNANPRIENCVFSENRGGAGGGMVNENQASPAVIGCDFISNAGIVQGGAIYSQNASSQPRYTNCRFINNSSGTPTINGWGGGMSTRMQASVIVEYCLFSGNTASSGGGGALCENASSGQFFYCVFTNNSTRSGSGTTGSGGGVQTGTNANVILLSCVVANNTAGGTNDDGGGGIMVYSGSTVTCGNTTVSGNTTLSTTRPAASGVSINPGSTLNFRSSILWGSGPQYYNAGAFTYLFSLVKGASTAIPTNLDLDPLFVDASNPAGPDGIFRTADDGLALTECSPAVNMGNNAHSVTPTDITGSTRIVSTTVDMGAYELQTIGPNIIFTDVIKTYGDPDAAVPNVTSCSGLPLTFTIDDNNIATIVAGNLHIVNAGTTTIRAQAPNGTPEVAVTLTVNPRPATVSLTAVPVVKTYDGNTNATVTAANLQFAPGDIIGTDNVVIAVSGNGLYDTKDIGIGKSVSIPLVAISLTGTSASNYVIANTTDVSATIGVINPLQITVTTDPISKVYGDADPVLTYTYAPALIGTEAFTGSLTRAPGENVGVYPISQGTLALSSNYTLVFTGNNFNITPKIIIVTAEPKTKTYGDADPALTYTYAPALVGTDAFTGSLIRVSGENVGSYTINQGTLALSANYTLMYVGDNLTITPKLITVTAEPKTKTYGDADPALTYTYVPALVGTDTFSGALIRATGENVGIYPINQGSLTLSANYMVTYISSILTITQKVIIVNAVPKTKVYGDADPSLTYTYAPVLVGTDAFTGALTRIAGENVGDYPINQGTLALSTNYQLNYTSADFVITKAVLTVTANDKTVCLTDPVTAFTITYTGFRFTDNISALSAQPTVSVPPYNTAGTYVLTPSGGAAMNYSFNYIPGQLTVLPVPEGTIAQVQVGPVVVTTSGVNSGVQLTAPQGTGYTYQWNNGAQTATILVRDNGIYSVRVTNPQGCWQVFSVLVKQLTLIIPNIFSPNGDGINDKWVIENLQNYPGSIVQIYNRYGQAVYKMVNYAPWDGRINGKEMPIGTYYYIIDLKNGQKPISGYIDIIR